MQQFTAKAVVFDLDGVLADSTAAFEEMEELEASFIDSVTAIEGAGAFVREIDRLGTPWAVATSGTRRIALPRLRRAQIPEPRVLITADDVANGKPDPEPYAKAAAALGVDRWDCVVFEDAPAGMLAARRAGARVIAVNANDDRLADASVRDFIDLDIAPCHREPVERPRARQGDSAVTLTLHPSRYRCECCDAHTLRSPDAIEVCALCRWQNGAGDAEYELDEARANVRAFGVYYRPADLRFAPARHPILGAQGEYAIDRVALRERAYRELTLAGKNAGNRAKPTMRLLALIACIENADRLYLKI